MASTSLKIMMLGGVCIACPLAAADGDIDTSFGVAGKQRVAFDLGGGLSDIATAAQIAGNGSIYLAGTAEIELPMTFLDAPGVIAIARLNADGFLDLTYNGVGRVTHQDDFGNAVAVGGNFVVNDAVLQPDGKLVVVGSVLTDTSTVTNQNYDMLVCRFLTTGQVDAGFGDVSTPGCAAIEVNPGADAPPSDFDAANAVALTGDGRIIVAGQALTSTQPLRAAVTRLNANGSIDPTFGTGGFVFTLEDGPSPLSWSDVAVAPDGKLVLVGELAFSAADSDFLVTRLNPNGTSDGSFGSGGLSTIAFNLGLTADFDQPTAVSVLANGSILVAGNIDFETMGLQSNARGVVKLATNGAIDVTFGSNGRTVMLHGQEAYAEDMVIQSDGRIVVAGPFRVNTNPGSIDFGVLRLTSNGLPDVVFGGNGQAAVAFDYNGVNPRDTATAVALQGGQIIMAGYVVAPDGGSNLDFAVTRLDNDLIFANDFEINP